MCGFSSVHSETFAGFFFEHSTMKRVEVLRDEVTLRSEVCFFVLVN